MHDESELAYGVAINDPAQNDAVRPSAPDAAKGSHVAHAGSVICPYCGSEESESASCSACGGAADPLSRQATQNEMGPWHIRDARRPHFPGCRIETIERYIRSGRLTRFSVIRGPTTGQFWRRAIDTPGIASLFGLCHSCQSEITPGVVACARCGAELTTPRDRQWLGLGGERPIPTPGSSGPTTIGSSAVSDAPRDATGSITPQIPFSESGVGVSPPPSRIDRAEVRRARQRARMGVAIGVAGFFIGIAAIIAMVVRG